MVYCRDRGAGGGGVSCGVLRQRYFPALAAAPIKGPLACDPAGRRAGSASRSRFLVEADRAAVDDDSDHRDPGLFRLAARSPPQILRWAFLAILGLHRLARGGTFFELVHRATCRAASILVWLIAAAILAWAIWKLYPRCRAVDHRHRRDAGAQTAGAYRGKRWPSRRTCSRKPARRLPMASMPRRSGWHSWL